MTTGHWTNTSDLYLTPGSGDAWAEEAAATDKVGTQQLTYVGEVAAPGEVAQALRLPTGAPVVVRRRVMYLNDTPVELTDSYYPTAVASGTSLAEMRKIPGGAVTLLAELGYTPADVHEDITARQAVASEREALALAGPDPVLILSRLSIDNIDNSARPYEFSIMTMKAAGRHLRYRLRNTAP